LPNSYLDPDVVPGHARLSSLFALPSALSADGVLVRERGHLDAGDLPGGQDAGGPATGSSPPTRASMYSVPLTTEPAVPDGVMVTGTTVL